MANIVEIIIKATDQASAVLNKTNSALSSYGSKISGVTRAITGFDAATLASTAGIGLLVNEYKKAINSTLEYTKQVRDLSRAIGATPEDVSKLIQAADDAQVSFGQLETSLVYGAKNGIDVTISGLMDLAEQYNAIQDPLERVKFLTDNFGRSGADMGAFMEMGAAGIEAAGIEAEKYGRILDENAIKQSEEFRIAQDNLNDSMSKMKDTMALEVMPALSDVLGIITPVIDAYNSLKGAVSGLDPALKEIVTTLYGFLDPIKMILGPIYALIDAFKKLASAMSDAGMGGGGGLALPGKPTNAAAMGFGSTAPIPRAAGGIAGGWTLVGERGPEVVNLPGGSNVIPNNQLGGGGSATISQSDMVYLGKIIASEIQKAIG